MKITLNLLPPIQKKKLRTQYFFRTILDQQILVGVLLILILLALLAVKFILDSEVKTLESVNHELEQKQEYIEIVELHELFTQTNQRMNVIADVQEKSIVWSGLFRLFNEALLSDITISSFETEDHVATLQGVAGRVDALVAFRDKLATTKKGDVHCFESVDVPDQYLVKSDDVDFVLTFSLNVESCMK